MQRYRAAEAAPSSPGFTSGRDPRQKSESRLCLRQTDIVFAAEGRGMPGPRRSPAPWIAGGLILQAVGAGGVAAYVWFKVRHQNLRGAVHPPATPPAPP